VLSYTFEIPRRVKHYRGFCEYKPGQHISTPPDAKTFLVIVPSKNNFANFWIVQQSLQVDRFHNLARYYRDKYKLDAVPAHVITIDSGEQWVVTLAVHSQFPFLFSDKKDKT